MNQLEILESLYKEKQHFLEIDKFEELAFIIHRFCGGKISFPVEDIAESHGEIDIQRTYSDGVITYITRNK